MTSPRFWAKSHNNGTEWLPLQVHLKDAYDTADYLWENWVPLKTKQIIVEGYKSSPDQVKQIYKYLAITHDLGKISVPFWDRSYMQVGDLSDRIRKDWEEFYPSSDFEYNNNRHEKATDFFLQHRMGTSPVLSSLISLHHGRSEELPAGKRKIQKVLGGETYFSYAETFYEEHIRPYIETFDISTLPKEATRQAMLLLANLLVMADWIASSSEFYPLIPSNVNVTSEEISGKWGKNRTIYAYEKLDVQIPETFIPGANIKSLMEQPLPFILKTFFGFDSPSPVQEELWKAVSSSGGSAELFIAEAEMGSGKTEAALVAAIKLVLDTDSSGFFIGLPTMATTDAMAKRVTPFLNRLANINDSIFSMSLTHSKSMFSEVQTVNIKNGQGLMDTGWFQSKTGKLLNSFSVGTIDQVLMMSLNAKHLMWRHLGLSSKVIILDEIHSADEYMLVYLENSLRWLAAYNCPVIALSATLTENQKKRLINAYNEGKQLR